MNWYILAIIPVLGLLVFVHELGHFLAAKWAGIRVEEFGMGFPPQIVAIRRKKQGGWEVIWFGRSREIDTSDTQNPFTGTSGGVSRIDPNEPDRTIYSLNLLPIGGFVRMPGENGDVHNENGLYDPKSFAAKSAGKRIIVLVAGVVMNVLLAIVLFSVAYTSGEPTYPPVIDTIQENSPAQAAGLRPNDTILAVEGKSVENFDQMRTEVSTIISQRLKENDQLTNTPIELLVRHSGEEETSTVVVNARTKPGPNQGALGVTGKVELVSSPLWQAPIKGFQRTFEATGLFLDTIGKMIIGVLPFQLSGPVGIAQITGDVAETTAVVGWWPILNLTAILSLNLAIFNILPFPALDGGRIVLILIEVVRGGKRLRPEREGLINFVGIAFLLLLMIVVTVSDIINWGG